MTRGNEEWKALVERCRDGGAEDKEPGRSIYIQTVPEASGDYLLAIPGMPLRMVRVEIRAKDLASGLEVDWESYNAQCWWLWIGGMGFWPDGDVDYCDTSETVRKMMARCASARCEATEEGLIKPEPPAGEPK